MPPVPEVPLETAIVESVLVQPGTNTVPDPMPSKFSL